MPKVLLVEDDLVWRTLLCLHLSGLRGIVDIITAGEDALFKFDEAARLKQPYEACVLDSMYPKKGGDLPDYSAPLETARELVDGKRLSSHRIFVVGSVAPYVKEELNKLGVNGFYFKEKNDKQPYQKHWSRLRADLSQSLRR